MKKNNSYDSRCLFPYKFNTTEKTILGNLSNIAKIVFEESFDIDSYLNSFNTFDNLKKNQTKDEKIHHPIKEINEINSSNGDSLICLQNQSDNLKYIELDFKIINSDSSSEIKESKDELPIKMIGIENIKYLIFKLFSSIHSSSLYDLYFQLINKNFNVFLNFFETKNQILSKYPHKKKHILKLEMVILNFLSKFMILKCHNYIELNPLTDTGITKHEINDFVLKKLDNYLVSSINLIDRPLESKYIIFKIKTKILELFKKYIQTMDNEFYTDSNQERYLRLYLIYYFSILLREYQLKPKYNLNNFLLKKELTNVITEFLKKLSKGTSCSEGSSTLVLDEEEIEIKLQTEYNMISYQIQNKNFIIESHNKEILNKFCDENLIFDYLKLFLSYDNRKHSVYSLHISYLIRDFYEEEDSISSLKEISFKIWNSINKDIIISTNFQDILHSILNYIFKNVEILSKLEKEKSISKSFNFVFGENLLQMVNFINNLLYYYSHNFQEKFLDGITADNFIVLLKVLIKLSNFIIGISDYADNSTFFSLSQKYFIFMDFFILICEGSISSKLNKYFFQDFNDEHDNKEPKNQYNFYFQCFLQLQSIIRLINVKKIGSFSFGSFRLIIQFLYITRFLKEFLEDDSHKDNENYLFIINNCFLQIFDFNWLISENIKNDYYSYTIKFELLNLLNAYLEEHFENLKSHDFQFKINQFFQNHEKIFNEIKICFDKAIEDLKHKNKKNDYNSLTFEKLRSIYIENEDSLYKNRNFELAELYYKLLRLFDKYYQSLKEEYDYSIVTNNYFEKNINDQENYDTDDDGFSRNNTLRMIRTSTLKNINAKKYNQIQDKEKKRAKSKMYFDFLLFIGREIEVKFKNAAGKFKLRKLFFFKPPRCYWLNKTFKNRLLDAAPRNSIGEKLNYFNSKLDLMLLEINLCYKARGKFFTYFFKLKFFHFLLMNLDLINFIFVLLINFLLLFYIFQDSSMTLDKDLNSQIMNYHESEEIQQKHVNIFCFTIAIFCLQIIFYLIWVTASFNIKFIKSAFKNILGAKYLLRDYIDEKEFKFDSFNAYDMMFKKHIDEDNKLLTLISYSKKSNLIITGRTLKILFWNKDIKYIVFTMICHLLFILTNYYLLLVIPIFLIVRLYSLFNYFLKAILSKYKEFIALLIFIYAIEYIFSWLTYLHFQDFMVNEYKLRTGDLNEDSKKEFLCNSALECFLNYIDLGLRLGGGIGDIAPRISYKYDEKRKYFLKLFLDIVFHILINLILGNIFFGVIVDTFNDLRDEKDIKASDINNKCFMCHLDRFDNLSNGNFDIHRKEIHHIFNYVYFIHYLLKKNPQIYSRAEQFAWEQFNMKKFDWFPYLNEKSEGKNIAEYQ